MGTSNKDLMRQARESLSGRWGLAIGAFFMYFIIIMAISLMDLVVPYAGTIITFLIAGAFSLGLAIFALAIARNEEAKLAMIFSGFKQFFKALGLFLLMMLLIVIGTILLIVPGIILALCFAFAFLILADNPNIGIVEALKKSKAMMYGYKLKMFYLFLCFLGLAILGLLTLGIAYLWLIPFIHVTYAKFYDDVKANYVEGQ